jgi:hypothetical protein
LQICQSWGYYGKDGSKDLGSEVGRTRGGLGPIGRMLRKVNGCGSGVVIWDFSFVVAVDVGS